MLPAIGAEGQRGIRDGHVAIVGLGALGCAAADLLARAGVGQLTLIDRDLVEWTNLQRQTLYTERDAQLGMPKAEAASARIAEINSEVTCRPIASDCHGENIERLLGLAGDNTPARPTLLLDATDNLETRFLLNDVAVKHRLPLVYGGVIATRGMHATFVPYAGGPCMRCVFGSPGQPGASPTCDTAGVLGSAVATVAAGQATDTLKLLTGRGDRIQPALTEFDVWTGHYRVLQWGKKDPECPCCGRRQFEFLGARKADAVSLCGQDAVQVRPATTAAVDLPALRQRLERIGQVHATRFMLKFTPSEVSGVSMSVFTDGRAIVHGTTKPEVARSMYARYIGV